MTLKIEASSGNVVSLGMVRLLALGGSHLEDGQIVVGVESLMSGYRDGVDHRQQGQENFPKQRHKGERDMER
jgi:hypothetical protein